MTPPFTPLYHCETHGDVWRIRTVDLPSGPVHYCEACGAVVTEKRIEFEGRDVAVFGMEGGEC